MIIFIDALKLQVACKIIAIVLHYAYLATFCWMLVEGLHLFRLIVIVYGHEKNMKWLYYAVGWGTITKFIFVYDGGEE